MSRMKDFALRDIEGGGNGRWINSAGPGTRLQAPPPVDPRFAELLDLARTEQITLPLPVDLIVWFESHGCCVDLVTGRVTLPIREPFGRDTRWELTPQGRAVSHLLTPAECEAEADDLEEGMLDEMFNRRGEW